MDRVTIVAVLLIAITGAILLFWFTRRHRQGWNIAIRTIDSYRVLREQGDKAVETGRMVHLSLGQADLAGQSNPAGIAALETLDYLAEIGAQSDTPPLATIGDGALYLAAQDSQRTALRQSGRSRSFSPNMAQFIAGREFTMSYAAGVSNVVNQGNLGSNLLFGRFGSEIAIVTEAGERKELEQIVGTDDPLAMAVGVAATDSVLIAEEFLAAGAYLSQEPAFLASLHLQDVLRVAAIVIILLVALIDLVL
ncbi:MAG: hypothetical protein JSW55_15795 [Chloroflexota bacterium]|nr:MAG: hypothetical protein JSW55_15795 [Chloroflexota bacterium]